MTKLLQQAFEEAGQLLSSDEQDVFARWVLNFVEDERKWDAAFSNPKSYNVLERLAAEALEDERAGRTDKLDPNAS